LLPRLIQSLKLVVATLLQSICASIGNGALYRGRTFSLDTFTVLSRYTAGLADLEPDLSAISLPRQTAVVICAMTRRRQEFYAHNCRRRGRQYFSGDSTWRRRFDGDAAAAAVVAADDGSHECMCVCVCSHNDDCVIVARRFINPPASPATYISTPNAGRHQSSPRRRLPPASVECVRRRCWCCHADPIHACDTINSQRRRWLRASAGAWHVIDASRSSDYSERLNALLCELKSLTPGRVSQRRRRRQRTRYVGE